MKKWECTVCGYIHEGDEPPDECPVCSADKSMFVEVTQESAPGEKAATEQGAVVTAQPTMLRKMYALAGDLIVKHHLHPITVHTPNGILPMALVFLLITAGFGFPFVEIAAFYSFIFVLLAMPLVLFTGYVIWQKRYLGTLTPIFKIKIGAALATVVLLVVLIIWRMVQPDIMTNASTGRWIYLGLSVLLVGAVGAAGHLGGKLVFGSRKN